MVKPFKEDAKYSDPYMLVVWEDLGPGDEGAPHGVLAAYGLGVFRTFTVSGDFAGASVDILGSLLPNDFKPINDMRQDVLFFDEPTFKSSPDLVLQVKPKVMGDTPIKVTVAMMIRKQGV